MWWSFFLFHFFVFRSGHLLDDGRMDHQTAQSHMAIYGANSALRNSSNSSSPGGGGSTILGGVSHGHGGTPAALLVVPQPINATKIGASLTNGTGTGRKYQCKMCPQVTIHPPIVTHYYYFICCPDEKKKNHNKKSKYKQQIARKRDSSIRIASNNIVRYPDVKLLCI